MSKKTKLPAPRLQLRWEPFKGSTPCMWQCHYELVIPLDPHDIRAEQEGPRGGRRPSLKELVVPMKKPTIRGGGRIPCTDTDGNRFYDDPYRDGVHAVWDSKLLGDLPIYVIAPDGMAFERPEDGGR